MHYLNLDAMVPDQFMSDRQFDRFHHLDIPDLEAWQIQDEINYLKTILWGAPQYHWVRERIEALRNELIERQPTNNHKPCPKPKKVEVGW